MSDTEHLTQEERDYLRRVVQRPPTDKHKAGLPFDFLPADGPVQAAVDRRTGSLGPSHESQGRASPALDASPQTASVDGTLDEELEMGGPTSTGEPDDRLQMILWNEGDNRRTGDVGPASFWKWAKWWLVPIGVFGLIILGDAYHESEDPHPTASITPGDAVVYLTMRPELLEATTVIDTSADTPCASCDFIRERLQQCQADLSYLIETEGPWPDWQAFIAATRGPLGVVLRGPNQVPPSSSSHGEGWVGALHRAQQKSRKIWEVVSRMLPGADDARPQAYTVALGRLVGLLANQSTVEDSVSAALQVFLDCQIGVCTDGARELEMVHSYYFRDYPPAATQTYELPMHGMVNGSWLGDLQQSRVSTGACLEAVKNAVRSTEELLSAQKEREAAVGVAWNATYLLEPRFPDHEDSATVGLIFAALGLEAN